MSELVGVMLVESAFSVQPEAAVNYNANKRDVGVFLSVTDNAVTWRVAVLAFEKLLVSAHCQYLAELSGLAYHHVQDVQGSNRNTDKSEHYGAAIDTAIAQAYDAFCLQYDLWRRASHIEWLPVLPMSLGVEPGQRSGTWMFAAAPAPKATSPEGQTPSGGKQKQHGKKGNDSAAGKAGVGKRSKRG